MLSVTVAPSFPRFLRPLSMLATLLTLAAGIRAGEATPKDAPKPDAVQLPEMEVTGKRSPVEQGERSIFTGLMPREPFRYPLTESPGLETATTVIGAEEIRWLQAYSLVDAMKYTPGGWTETRGRKVKQFFSVRGQRYPYPDYVLDGGWFREFHETNYFLSAANIDRIEIIRSSAVLLLGPGGMTGTVHVIPRTYTKRHTQLDVIYGSDFTWRTQLSHGDTVGSTSYAVGLGFHHTDGPHDMNAEESVANLYARVVTRPTERLTIGFTAIMLCGDRELKLAEPPASGTHQTRKDSYDPMRTYMFVATARYEASEALATDVVLNFGQRRFDGHRVGSPDWLENDYEYGARVVQSIRLTPRNTLRVGGLFNHWVTPTGKRFYVGRRGDLWTYSGVIVDEHDFGRLRVNAGYRITRTYYEDFGGFNVEGSAGGLTSVQVSDEWEDPLHTIMLGASYALTEQLSLHANFAWGNIAARPGMLDVDLDRPGTETRTKCDLGIKHAWDGLGEVTLTGFCVRQQDAPLTSAASVTVDGEDFALYENADRRSYGVELDVRTQRFKNGFQLFFNAVAMKTKREFAAGWARDEEVPEVILGGGISYLFRDVEFALLAKRVNEYENERFLPRGSAPAPLGDFTEYNAKITYYFGKKKQHSAFVAVENISDNRYSVVAGYPDEGRQFRGGFSLAF